MIYGSLLVSAGVPEGSGRFRKGGEDSCVGGIED